MPRRTSLPRAAYGGEAESVVRAEMVAVLRALEAELGEREFFGEEALRQPCSATLALLHPADTNHQCRPADGGASYRWPLGRHGTSTAQHDVGTARRGTKGTSCRAVPALRAAL
ncbi:unnamed protein product [Urochloa humidicola]